MAKQLTPVQEVLLDCFVNSKGCRVVMCEGPPLELRAGSLELFNKTTIHGTDENGARQEIVIEDIASVEPLGA